MLDISRRAIGCTLLALLAVYAAANECNGRELSQADLRAYTQWSVRTGRVKLPRPKLEWGDDYLNFNFSGMDDSYGLDSQEPISIPLTEQFTVLAIRTYRCDTQKRRQFWEPVLRKVEAEIAGMVSTINAGTLQGENLLAALDERSLRISYIYRSELSALAQSYGREGANSVAECACYCVMLKTDPPNGAIQYISAGRWNLYLFMTKERGVTGFPKPDWISVVQSDCVPLTGKNWFYVQWPDGREANDLVVITSANDLTFTPDP